MHPYVQSRAEMALMKSCGDLQAADTTIKKDAKLEDLEKNVHRGDNNPPLPLPNP